MNSLLDFWKKNTIAKIISALAVASCGLCCTGSALVNMINQASPVSPTLTVVLTESVPLSIITQTIAPHPTQIQTSTVVSTVAPISTQTNTSVPTQTALPTQTHTALPTNTALPTRTPLPTNTVRPTSTTRPTDVPIPTNPPATQAPVGSVCDCSADLYNCTGAKSIANPQQCYDHCWALTGRDVHGLDGDNDGVVCEG